MKRPTWPGLLLCLLFVAGLARTTGKAHAQGGPTGQILELVNQVRAEHGLPPYRYNATLSIAAQNHANWMASNVIYSHTGAGGSSPQDRAAAVGYNGYVSENIVGGWQMTPNQGVIWWRNSAIHYSMMVSNRYSEAGVGFATNGRENMYVLVMGRPANSPAPAAPAEPEPQAEPLIITPIELAEPREDGSIVHVVQEGQALWQIAAHYEVKLPDILLINGLSEDDFLHPGDEVIVRLADDATPPPTPTPPLTYIVREGDNPWIIAHRFQIDLATFFYLNGLTEDDLLHAGNEVRIRLGEGEAPPPTPTPKLTHRIEEGDTAWSIAAQYGLEIDELLAMNGLGENPLLQVGDELFIRATPTPEVTATPEVTETPTATASSEPSTLSLVASEAPTAETPPPTETATPAPSPEETESDDDGGGGLLYIASLLLAGAGLLMFVGVVMRKV